MSGAAQIDNETAELINLLNSLKAKTTSAMEALNPGQALQTIMEGVYEVSIFLSLPICFQLISTNLHLRKNHICLSYISLYGPY